MRSKLATYRIDETASLRAPASFGSLLSSGERHHRWLSVELRVGDYKVDNTNFMTMPSFSSSVMVRSFGGVATG